MSFHFRTLHLKNWLVYGGAHSVSFPDYHQGQNLVVINGQNGFGKTSLLRALQFVFHGLTRSELVDVWSDQQRQDKGELEVGLEFIHGNKLCKIIRSVRFTQRGNTFMPHPDVQMWVDGEMITDQLQDKIIQMLPK